MNAFPSQPEEGLYPAYVVRNEANHQVSHELQPPRKVGNVNFVATRIPNMTPR